jgi:DNA-3-methyladenine glycosylase II
VAPDDHAPSTSAFFPYGAEEIGHLSARDKRLGRAIEQIGYLERRVTPDVFTALVNCIVDQQISSKAAETIWRRLTERFELTPASLAAADVEAIQQCGITMRKASYISGISRAVAGGDLDLGALNALSDDEVIRALSAWPGIGVWTAEMILIFSLMRPDVLSFDDLAIRRGMMNLYGHKTLTKERFARYRKRYSPYGSVASLYLWELSVSKR